MGKEKVQFTLTFHLKQNKEVQLDLQHFEIFIFSSLLPSLLPGKMLEEKLRYGFEGINVINNFFLIEEKMFCSRDIEIFVFCETCRIQNL